MKSGRLLEMLLLLQARGQVTARDLAGRLEVSRRTVYRDAEALSSAGVPIYTERGRAGGIRLLPGYRTDVTGLTHDEARALFVLTTGGAQEDLGLGAAARSAVLKVMRAVPEPFRPAAAATSQRILVDPAGWMRTPDPVGQLGVLQAAVFTDRRLRLRYRSSGHGEPEASRREAERSAAERVVDPYGLVCKAGVWYLVADSDGEPRLFRVSRVASAVADEAPVRRRDGVELAQLWESLRRQIEDRPAPVPVVARVRREWLDMFCRICAAHLDGPVDPATDAGAAMITKAATPETGAKGFTITDGGDGEWVMLRLRFAAVPAARTLLSFGGNVEVVSPPKVRADLASVATDIVARYGLDPAGRVV
ncbi:MAG TPA: WYL domain-containing protein [Streptosporangiaceae bacterium]|nr:WYL domain-containing protein [Streptosporangiaceae bacterium]